CVGALWELAPPPHPRRGGAALVAVAGEPLDELGVLDVALDEPVARVVVVRLREAAVLAEVVDADNVVARLEELGHEVAADEARSAGDQDAHLGPHLDADSFTHRAPDRHD